MKARQGALAGPATSTRGTGCVDHIAMRHRFLTSCSGRRVRLPKALHAPMISSDSSVPRSARARLNPPYIKAKTASAT